MAGLVFTLIGLVVLGLLLGRIFGNKPDDKDWD